MADVLSKGNLFDPILVTDLFDKVRGKSSLAVLGKRTPIAFTGNKLFTFSMDSEVDIVAENGKKTKGGMTLAPVVMAPIKFEYSARVSDEFLYATEERKIEIIKKFNEGFAKKLARGLDIAAILGLNPRSKEESTVIGDNCLAKKVDQTVTYESATADVKIEDALGLVEGSEYTPSGIVLAPSVRTDISKMRLTSGNRAYPDFAFGATPDALGLVEGSEYTPSGIVLAPSVRTDISKMRLTSGNRAYPDFAFGATPSNLGSQKLEVNNTVSYNSPTNKLVGVVGDFETAFEWGYAKEVMLEVIQYGDPDSQGKDLKASYNSPTNKLVGVVGDFETAFEWGYAKEVMLEVIQYGDPDSQGKDLKAYNQVCLRGEAYLGWGILDGKAFAKLETA